MLTTKQLLTFAYHIEYESAYDLSQKRNFSLPKIYTAKGDLSKRWYVYFSYRHPQTGKLKRITPFYGNVNNYKTKEERLEVLTVYRKTLLKLLKQGYNPFLDNTELYDKLNSKKQSSALKTDKQPQENNTIVTKKTEEPKITIKEAFDFGLKLKEKLISDKTRIGYESRIDIFLKWLKTNYPALKTIDELNKKHVSGFLNHILDKTTSRNRNNYRADLASIMQVLADNDIVLHNFIRKIPVLKSTPERHKTYTQEIQEAIFKQLEDKDPRLLLYIKFIAYSFLRPVEVCRLKIKDINLKEKTIQFKAKNSPLKTKIIPQILFDELPDLSECEGDDYLFTPTQIGGVWNTDETNKRDYFSKRFKKVVKDPFKLGTDYGLYSFRHTYITMVYRALIKTYAPFEAKSRLMLITGHTSMSALEKYLRDIDAELPSDYSEMLTRPNE